MQINPLSNHGPPALDVQALERLLMLARSNNSVISRRLEWVLDYARGNSVTGTCRRFGIARTTLYRWLKRFSQAPELTGPPPHGPNSASPSCLPPSKRTASGGCPCCALRARLGALRDGWGRRLLVASIVLNLLLVGLALFEGLSKGQPSSAKTPGPVTSFPGYEQQSQAPASPLLLHTLLGIDIAQAATGIYRPINYQGKLTNSGGIAISNGNYNLRFKIFAASSGGNPVWSETWDNATQRVTSTGGLFSIALGTHTAMTGSVNFNSDSLFLQIEFDPGNDGTYEEVFSPRRRFASVPYAHNANSLDGLDSTQFIRSDTSYTASGTITVAPKSASKIGIDILSTAGTASTGALRLSTQGANHIVFGSGGANYDTNLYRSAASSLKTDGTFTAGRMLSGARLTVSGNANVSGSLIVRKTISGAALEILGTASGLNLFATQSVSGTYLYAASTFGGAGLTSCSTATTSKLLYNSATKQFSCGTDQTGGSAGTASFSGSVLLLGDARYVKKQGDTMTGVLILNPSGGVTAQALRVLGTQALTGSALLVAGSSTTKPLVVKGAASQTANLQEWQSSSGVALLSVAANGQVVSPTDGIGAQFGRYEFNGPTYPGLLSSPGNNFVIYSPWPYKTQIETGGADVEIGSFASPKVNIYGKLAVGSNAATSQAQITIGSAGTPGLIVKGAASQFANLQEWQNSAGTVLAGIDKSGSGFLAALGVGTPSPKARLDVVGTISGKTLIVSGNGSFSGSLTVKRTISGAALEVLGTASGLNLFATQSITGTHLFAATTFAGAGLASCSNATTSKLLWNSTTKQFSCGTDQSGSSGISLSVADERYVKKQGDTMTGTLTINLTAGTIGLNVLSTMSGNTLTVSKGAYFAGSGVSITSSGQTVFNELSRNVDFRIESDGDANAFFVKAATDFVGIGKNIPKAKLDVQGTASGSALTVSGLANCNTNNSVKADAQGNLFCATDEGGGGSSSKWTDAGTITYLTATADDLAVGGSDASAPLYLNTAAKRLEVVNISGGTLRAQDLLTSSGSLSVEGATILQSTLTVTGNAVFGTNTMFVDALANRVGVGTGAPQATLEVAGTVSGTTLQILGTASGQNLFAARSISGTHLYAAMTFGGAGLASCSNAATSKLLYDGATKQLSCGTDQNTTSSPEVGTSSFSGSVLVLGDARYVKRQGDTVTGALTINVTGGSANTVGLKVYNTISGAIIHAAQQLRSSGTILATGAITAKGTLSGRVLTVSGNASITGSLVVNRSISGATLEILGTASGKDLFVSKSVSGTYLYAASTFGGAGLTSCSNATTSKLLWNSTTKQFSCGTDQAGGGSGTFGSGNVLPIGDARYVKKSGDTMTGALTINLTAGSIGLNVLSTMSGNSLVISKGAFFSGSGITFTSTGQTVFNRLNRNVDFSVRGSADSNLLYADASSDRIGIGTNMPKAKLDIVGTLSGKTLTISGNGSFSGSLVVKRGFSGAALEVLGTLSGGALNVTGTGAKPLLFTSSPWGGVGIGTSTPAQRLTVSGGSILNLAGGALKPLSGINLGGDGKGVAVVGSYAYVAGGGTGQPELRIIDISNKLQPAVVGQLDVTSLGGLNAVAVAGRYAYTVGTNGAGDLGLRIVDVTNPSAPLPVSTLSLGNATETSLSVAVSGHYAYVGKSASFSSGTLYVIDVSNPFAPSVVGQWSAGAPVDIDAVAATGRYAYLGTANDLDVNNEFQVLDVSNPSAPAVRGGLNLDATVNTIAVAGRYAYLGLASNGGAELRIIDISNPGGPTSVGGLEFGTDGVKSVAIAGKYAYIGTTNASGANSFKVIDVSTASAPVVVGAYSAGSSVNALTAAGKHAYLGLDSVSGNDFVILDLNGIDAPSATIGTLGVNVLYASDSVSIQNLLDVVNGITVGPGGIRSDGMLTVSVGSGSTISNLTGAVIVNRGMTGTVLALDSYRANGTGRVLGMPHILFGYRGLYDTNLYRAGTGMLATDGTFLARAGTGITLLKLESKSATQSDNLIEVFSSNGLVGSSPHNRVFRVTAGGDAKADGSFTGGGADYAERFLASTPNLQSGQAVCLDPLKSNTVKLCDRSGDPNVMGIISTKPAFVGDKYHGADGSDISDKNSAIVGLIGQLPAKAIVEDGQAIAVGDTLTPASKPGYVRKAKAGESTVGVALSPLDKGEGSIDVLITRRNQSDLVEKIENEVTQSIAEMNLDDDIRQMVQIAMNGASINGAVAAAVNAQVQSLNLAGQINAIINQRLADGSLNLGSEGTLAEDVFSALRSASGRTAINDAVSSRLGLSRTGTSALTAASDLLVDGSLTVQHDVLMGGTLHAAAIQGPVRFDGPIQPGADFAIGSLSFTGSAVRIGSLADKGALQVVGDVTIDGLSTFLGGLEVRGELIVSSNQAGFAVIPAYAKSVTVTFGTGFVSTPVVNATPNGLVGSEWWIDAQSQTGFTIRTDKTVAKGVKFSWTALGVREAKTAAGVASAESMVPFHVDAEGRPDSVTDSLWNSCIRDPNALDVCRGYHQGTQWFLHPDIVQANQPVLPFTYDASVGPSSLVLPDSYEAAVVEHVSPSSSGAVVSSAASNSSEASSVSGEALPSPPPPAEPAGEQRPGEPPLAGDATGPADPGPAPDADSVDSPGSPPGAEGGAQQ